MLGSIIHAVVNNVAKSSVSGLMSILPEGKIPQRINKYFKYVLGVIIETVFQYFQFAQNKI